MDFFVNPSFNFEIDVDFCFYETTPRVECVLADNCHLLDEMVSY